MKLLQELFVYVYVALCRALQQTDEKRKTSLEKMVATELLKLAMETEEEGRKERLKKMVANHSAEASP